MKRSDRKRQEQMNLPYYGKNVEKCNIIFVTNVSIMDVLIQLK